ncbi:MAG: sulfatase-like hydrolase/transferase, partial [Gemmatimonadota bacterium]|nr:sulfatase-like hydrolase/transferase [Gemmatimonadota bacterium]
MEQRPNILLITTDQHSAEALGHLGCNDVKTPGMDRLAARGISFTKSYSANPVCCPARASWFTGRHTPENGVVANGANMVPTMPDLGQWLNKNGYNAYYSGKWHIPGRDVAQSFHHICPDPRNTAETGDIASTRSAIGFLQNYQEKDPFFLSVGLLNPHDICSFVLTHTMHDGKMPFPEIDDLPPLPPNFEIDMAEPEKIISSRNQKLADRGEESGMEKWEEKLFRYYIWTYYRYIEKVDGQIGLILDALENSAFKDNTVVILTSDHGDGHIRHKMVFKSFLYDEAVRVPFIMSWPGHIKEQVIDQEHLVSGVDVFPTVCDYAGISPPPMMRGYSLRAIAEG